MQVRILMVCLGNICRSPLAEGILNHLTDESVFVDSAGTAGYHTGNPPDPRSVAVARKNDIDISRQRCRQFETSDFDDFDYIFAMDRENLQHLKRMARNEQDLRKLSLLLDPQESGVSEVPDPYYGGADGFEVVFDMIRTACHRLSRQLGPQ
jgi:protein-tyrosine phosphatase